MLMRWLDPKTRLTVAQTDLPPRYLRFARALALVSGIAAPMSGCSLAHQVDDVGTRDGGHDRDAGPQNDAAPLPDVFVSDAGSDAPYVDPCLSCECVFGGDLPPPPTSCEALGTPECCYAVGPLNPPELPA